MKLRVLLNNRTEAKIANGMDLYRMVIPYLPLAEYEVKALSTDEFDTTDLDGDVYIMNRSREYFRAKRVKEAGKLLIIDIDDYWVLPTWHPLRPERLKAQLDWAKKNPERVVKPEEVTAMQRLYVTEINASENIVKSMKIADVVTCSTEHLAEVIRKELNIEPLVIRNTIHPSVVQFQGQKSKSRFTRFGWIGGSFHGRDVALMYDGLRRLHGDKKEAGKYQILSSFNDTPEYREIEKIMTNGYKVVSPEYREWLLQFTTHGDHIGLHEPYRRMWNAHVTEYGYAYEDIDVALIPLASGKFTSCKSELKLIEAGWTGCAAIVSDVMPYSPWLKHGHNCLTTKGTNGWYSAMKILINNPEYRAELAYNLQQTIVENFHTGEQAEKIRTKLKQL